MPYITNLIYILLSKKTCVFENSYIANCCVSSDNAYII